MKTNLNIFAGIKKDRQCGDMFEAYAKSLNNIYSQYANPARLKMEFNAIKHKLPNKNTALAQFDRFIELISATAQKSILYVDDDNINAYRQSSNIIDTKIKYYKYVPVFVDGDTYYSVRFVSGISVSAYHEFINSFVNYKLFMPLMNPLYYTSGLDTVALYNDNLPINMYDSYNIVLPYEHMTNMYEIKKNVSYLLDRLPPKLSEHFYHMHIPNRSFRGIQRIPDTGFVSQFRNHIGDLFDKLHDIIENDDEFHEEQAVETGSLFHKTIVFIMLENTDDPAYRKLSLMNLPKELYEKGHMLLAYFISIYYSYLIKLKFR